MSSIAGRRVGRDHPVPGVYEVAGQQAAAAAELHDEPVAFEDGFEQRQDAGRAVIGMEPEAQVMDPCQVSAVVGLLPRHVRASSHRVTPSR